MPDKTGIKFYLLSSVMHPYTYFLYVHNCVLRSLSVHNWRKHAQDLPTKTEAVRLQRAWIARRAEPVTTLVAGFPAKRLIHQVWGGAKNLHSIKFPGEADAAAL